MGKKQKISSASARRIVASASPLDPRAVNWVEQWIENYLRNNCLPLQFCSSDFDNQIMGFLPPLNAELCLKRIREEFKRLFSTTDSEPENMDFLVAVVNADTKSLLHTPRV